MTKQEFLKKIKKGIKSLPQKEINKHLQFYSEMIDDRVEDGMDESEAVVAAGDVGAIVEDILREKSLNLKSVNSFEKKQKKSLLLKSTLCVAALTAQILSAIVLFAAAFLSAALGIMGIVWAAFMLFGGVASLHTLWLAGAFLAAVGISAPLFILAVFVVKKTFKRCGRSGENIKTEEEELL